MAKCCQNDLCKNEAAGQVPVPVPGPSNPKRALCTVCRRAYDWGVEHGRRTALPQRIWVLAVTERESVVHSGVFRTRFKAVQGLAQYLRTYHGYRGPAAMPSISNWLAERAEDLGVDIFPAPLQVG